MENSGQKNTKHEAGPGWQLRLLDSHGWRMNQETILDLHVQGSPLLLRT